MLIIRTLNDWSRDDTFGGDDKFGGIMIRLSQTDTTIITTTTTINNNNNNNNITCTMVENE